MGPNYHYAKSEAARILSEFGITEPPVNPAEIARSLGLQVLFIKFSPKYSNISGFYDVEENAIYVNQDEYPKRQTFTIAHELGHQILHREWAASADYKMLLRTNEGDEDDPKEKEANTFAANLLVPKTLLDKYKDTLPPAFLSELFAVSLPVITNRLNFEYHYA